MTRPLKTIVACVAVFAIAALPALAAGAEGAAEGKTGLPQMDTDTFVGQLFWLAVTFAFLYFVISRVAAPRIATVIEERRDRVADDLDRASEFKAQAEAASKAYDKAVADARAKARAVSDETRRKAKVEADRKRAEADAHIADDLAAAGVRIAAKKSAVLADIRVVAAETTQSVISRLTGILLAPGEAAAAVDAALKR